MEVIIHYPKEKEALDELKELMAMVHADLAASLVHNLSCSEEQKCTLLKLISDECHKKADNT